MKLNQLIQTSMLLKPKVNESKLDLVDIVNDFAKKIAEYSNEDFKRLKRVSSNDVYDYSDFDDSYEARKDHYDLLISKICKEKIPFVEESVFTKILKESSADFSYSIQ